MTKFLRTASGGMLDSRCRTLAAALALFTSAAIASEAAGPQIVMPFPDADRGQFLFVSKGCVVCHAVNGVGGKAGPALDAPADGAMVDPVEFAARMWRGAFAMTLLQSQEFGYQIEMTGQEIADLAAFSVSLVLQATFSEEDIPEIMRGWTLDENFSEMIEGLSGEDWPSVQEPNEEEN